jgi:hypothetical protein
MGLQLGLQVTMSRMGIRRWEVEREMMEEVKTSVNNVLLPREIYVLNP